jgi:hypothetical protein
MKSAILIGVFGAILTVLIRLRGAGDAARRPAPGAHRRRAVRGAGRSVDHPARRRSGADAVPAGDGGGLRRRRRALLGRLVVVGFRLRSPHRRPAGLRLGARAGGAEGPATPDNAPPAPVAPGGDAAELLAVACDPTLAGEADADNLADAVRIGRAALRRAN